MNPPAVPDEIRKSKIYLIIWIVIAVIFYTGAIFWVGIKFQEHLEQTKKVLPASTEDKSEQNCVAENFIETDWDTSRFNKIENGFWCPKNSFVDPVMWWQKGIPLSYKSSTLEYEIKKAKTSFGYPPSLILEFAQKKDPQSLVYNSTITPIYKLWVPEGESLQLFRFSKNQDYTGSSKNPDDLLKPEEAFTLRSPVKLGGNNTLKIIFLDKIGNSINASFLYTYIPDFANGLDTPISDPISKNIKLPLSNTNSTNEHFYYGLGTYKGNCIRPISFYMCVD